MLESLLGSEPLESKGQKVSTPLYVHHLPYKASNICEMHGICYQMSEGWARSFQDILGQNQIRQARSVRGLPSE